MSEPGQTPGREDGVHKLARPFLFLDRTAARDVISLCIVLIAMILLAVDFFIDRHGETQAAETPGFFAIYGFVCFAAAVLAGWPLRAILMRGPDYYGESEDSDA